MKTGVIKCVVCLLCLLMSLHALAVPGGFSGPTWYDYREAFGGNGSLLDPYVISKPEHLAQLSYEVNEEAKTYEGKIFILADDISLDKTVDGQRVQWIPIGYKFSGENYHFRGVLFGADMKKMYENGWSEEQKHTVSGMYIHAVSNVDAQCFGLFGYMEGLVAYVDVANISLTVDLSEPSSNDFSSIGGLCGRMVSTSLWCVEYGNEPEFLSMGNGIDACSVEGGLAVKANGQSVYVGGIVGGFGPNCGIGHTVSNVSITAERCDCVGGIAASSEGTIVDCAANVNIVSSAASGEKPKVGGIVGLLWEGSSVSASASMGSITCTEAHEVGGICGRMRFEKTSGIVRECVIRGCSSTVALKTKGELGGIVGHMEKGNDITTRVDACVYGGHIDASEAFYSGGICGYMEWDNDLRINASLFTGTMSVSSGHRAAISAYCPNGRENVGGCYYDATMFSGNLVGEETTHLSIKGVSTEDLTSGRLTDVSMLPTDESEDCFFIIAVGRYPAICCNTVWNEYYDCFVNNSVDLDFTKQLFHKDNMYQDNTVYKTGAWLCSLPVSITKGDAAYDLVTQVIASDKNNVWEEQERTVTVNSKCTYSNVECIKISGDTATAVANGDFMATITAKTDRPAVVWNRPLPLSGTKQLAFTSTVDQEWDGTFATACAAGTGRKEDPYIIKNGAQLAYAVKNNSAGEFYKQICDITLNKELLNDEGILTVEYTPKKWIDENPYTGPWGYTETIKWKAQYDGTGHFIKGARISREGVGVFGSVEESGAITNLGIVDSHTSMRSGLFAGSMNGTITNCIAQGTMGAQHVRDADYYKDYCGGFASVVGNTNAGAVIEDCISSVVCRFLFEDVTPFVSLSDENHGKVRNCLSVVPMIYADADFNSADITASGKDYLENCYWLKGYEQMNTGYTLEEICAALGSRSRWKVFKGYFPTLKTFANTDMAKLLMVPFRTDQDYTYDESYGSDNYLMGFGKQLLFEPGSVAWTSTDETETYLEADSDMGIIVPVRASFDPIDINPNFDKTVRVMLGLYFINGRLGKFHHFIPMRTRKGGVNPGISFVDDYARAACLEAFDSNHDDILSLAELKAVTTDQTLTAFQTETARQMVRFPEFRFFKAVDELTSQLSGLDHLEEIGLPYAMETLGSDAFDGCASLKEVTLPAKVKYVDPHPFYGSAVEDISVDPFNENYKSRGGVLFDANDMLVAYPNGRSGEEIVIPGVVTEIADGAVYKIDGLQRFYFETDDYKTVPYLNEEGITTTDDQLIDVYVSDATYGSVLMQGYIDDGSWDEYVDAGKLHCYYPLKIGNAKAATLYIGFDTQLPAGLKPYIVTKTNDADVSEEEGEKNTAYLQQMPSKVPSRSPIVIFADQAGTYRLEPLGETLEPWKMYKNKLNGVGRDGMSVYQSDSDRGSILTLGRNSSGTLGFFYYTGERIAPYRAYLTHNEITAGAKYFISFLSDHTGIANVSTGPGTSSTEWYTLDGRKLSGKPSQRGVYISGGRKVFVK